MKLLVLTAPSGAGKTTLARRLMQAVPGLRFSVSATTRPPRPGETDGVHYHFLSLGEFSKRLDAGAFVEHEEVYPGRFYGTPCTELEALAGEAAVRAVVLDVDVMGAATVKRLYGDAALAVFIAPPSLAELGNRLRARGTETPEQVGTRLERAGMEMEAAHRFDAVVVNDDLDRATAELVRLVETFLGERGAGSSERGHAT